MKYERTPWTAEERNKAIKSICFLIRMENRKLEKIRFNIFKKQFVRGKLEAMREALNILQGEYEKPTDSLCNFSHWA